MFPLRINGGKSDNHSNEYSRYLKTTRNGFLDKTKLQQDAFLAISPFLEGLISWVEHNGPHLHNNFF